jgi:hypothetical protein
VEVIAMPPSHFSVTQVRIAAACPRILYFDHDHTRRNNLKQPTVTRIWKAGAEDEATACGTLFHAAVEKFNREAAAGPEVRQLVADAAGDAAALAERLLGHVYRTCVNREALFEKAAPQQQAFVAALRRYLSELAAILTHALALGRPLDDVLDQLFGDRRRRTDVTFHVGRGGEGVHVSGVLDYVFYDWRTAHNRILDYKLTPARQPSSDLFQVCVYALMHHLQHRSEPDVGVLYLHPERRMVEKPWEQLYAERHKVYNLLASMREWVRYDGAGQGLKPPGDPVHCDGCRWRHECVQRLGPKHEGERLEHWTDRSADPPPEVRESPPAAAAPTAPVRLNEGVGAGAHYLGAALDGGLPVELPAAALPTHVAVVGAAGSGKTWVAKVLAEEAVLRGVPVLAVDPQGDLVQFLRPRPRGEVPAVELDRYDRFWEAAGTRVFTPGSSHGARLSLNPIRLPADGDLRGIEDPQRRAEELNGMLATVASNLVSLARAGGEVDSQQTFVLQVLRRLTAGASGREVGLSEVGEALRDPVVVGMDDADAFVKKAERERLARKLNGLLHGPAASLFSGGTRLDIAALQRPGVAGKVPLNVFYLNALTDDEQKQFFVASLAAEVYRWMVTSGSSGGARLLFYLDEARDYIPAGGRKPTAKEPLIRLFTQGRKYGVACLLCTQSPRSVDYNVFGNCSTKVIGRLESAQDADRVAEWFAVQGRSPAWLRGRAGAPPGTFVVRWPGMPETLEGRAFRSRLLYSAHEGAWSPDRVEQEVRALGADGLQ